MSTELLRKYFLFDHPINQELITPESIKKYLQYLEINQAPDEMFIAIMMKSNLTSPRIIKLRLAFHGIPLNFLNSEFTIRLHQLRYYHLLKRAVEARIQKSHQLSLVTGSYPNLLDIINYQHGGSVETFLLHWSATHGQTEVMKYLLQVMKEPVNNHRLLFLCSEAKHREGIKIFQDRGGFLDEDSIELLKRL